jgi:D-3-phosphoglycerate dehydrogenase
VATDIYPVQKPWYVDQLWPAEQVDRLFAESDVVVLAAPLTEATRGIVNERTLALMPRGSILINVARGPLVDEPALVAALRSGHLAGAGVDVTAVEPLPVESPLWGEPNLIITPHVGGQSLRRADDVTDLLCANLRRWLAKKPLLNLVDKRLGWPDPDHWNIPAEPFGPPLATPSQESAR